MGPLINDNSDKMLGLLQQIVENTSDEDDGADLTINQNGVGAPSDDGGVELFATGPNRIAIEESDGFKKFEFGIQADIINLRTTEDVLLAFTKDGTRNGGHLKVRGNESPFTIGGNAGIDTGVLWIKKADTATATPGIELIAFK